MHLGLQRLAHASLGASQGLGSGLVVVSLHGPLGMAEPPAAAGPSKRRRVAGAGGGNGLSPAAAPLVSIICPVHNAKPWLDDCFGSILAQTYPAASIQVVCLRRPAMRRFDSRRPDRLIRRRRWLCATATSLFTCAHCLPGCRSASTTTHPPTARPRSSRAGLLASERPASGSSSAGSASTRRRRRARRHRLRAASASPRTGAPCQRCCTVISSFCAAPLLATSVRGVRGRTRERKAEAA